MEGLETAGAMFGSVLCPQVSHFRLQCVARFVFLRDSGLWFRLLSGLVVNEVGCSVLQSILGPLRANASRRKETGVAPSNQWPRAALLVLDGRHNGSPGPGPHLRSRVRQQPPSWISVSKMFPVK